MILRKLYLFFHIQKMSVLATKRCEDERKLPACSCFSNSENTQIQISNFKFRTAVPASQPARFVFLFATAVDMDSVWSCLLFFANCWESVGDVGHAGECLYMNFGLFLI